MKKSFAENCIRYISTATALILALAMLCCANFSASAKDLGSNLTITDTTLLLQDINTTTNTTPAKTKDLIASGANIDLLSTGFSGTIYVNASALNLSTVYIHYWGGPNSTTYPGIQMTSLGNGIFSYEIPSSDNPTNCLFHDNATNNKIQTADLTISDNYCTLASDKTATWSTYSGGSDTPTGDLTIYYKNTNNWSTVNIYCWQNSNDNNKNNAWPGKSMTKVEGTDDIYSYTISTSSNWDRCIFSDGSNSGNKTTDFTIPSNGKNYYNGSSWSSLYTVTFNNNGYGATPNRQYIASGSTATDPGTLTAEGQTFGGWYTDSACTNKYNFSTAVTGNITLYAKWSAISTEDITVYFDNSVTQWENVYVFYWNKESLTDIYDSSGKALKGNGTEVKYKTISNVTSQLLSVAVPYNTTYIAFTSFKGNATQNMDTYDNFYGTGEKEFIACYYTNSSDNKFTLDNNTHKFSSSRTVFTPSGNTASNTYNSTKYINGTWSEYTVPKHTVTFDNKGHGGTTESQLVTDGQCATEPTKAPTASGYTFGGWYTDENCTEVSKYNFNTHVTGNITLYAKWTANEYTVTFDYKDGTTTPTTTVVTYNKAYGELPNPTRENYSFGGWYLEEEFTNEVTSTITVTTADNHTLYAKWTAKEYNITYVLNDGTINGTYATKYTYGVGAKLPTDVTKDGYTFKDWYDNEELTGDPVKSISQEATGNKTFYAKWELNAFKHKYVFLEVSGKDWFYNHSSYGVVSFDGGTKYYDMQELFTNTSTYNSSANKSNLLFAEVPEGTETIIFSRKNGNTVIEINKTTYTYSQFTTNNLLTLESGENKLNGSWSTVNYTPVPVSVTHGANGTVVASKTLADTTTTITVKKGETKYFDASTTGISVTVTPITDYKISSFIINGEEKKTVFENLETGGTYDLGTLSATEYDIQATFEEVPKENPTVKIESIPNSTINFTYTDENNTEQTVTAPGSYVVKYKSDISLVISPNPGYHLVSITGMTTESTLPVAGNVTATASQIKTNLTVSYELAKNPTVTIEVPANCTVEFAYTNDNGVSTTANATGTYSVYYGSDISYKVNPKDGYYVATMTGVTTQSPTPPVAEAVTGSISNIIADVTDTITCTINPNPTVKVICCDTDGTELGAEKVTLKFGTTDIISSEGKKVTYNSDTANTFTATAVSEDEYHFSGFYTQRPTVSSPVSDDNKITTTEISTDDYKTSAAENVLTVKNVKNDVTFYAVFSQLYRVEFIFSNLEKFTIDGSDKIGDDPIVSGSCVYVAKDAILSLKATVGDDYQLKKSSWTYTDENGVFTFNNDSAEDVTYQVKGNSTITITPQIATYTGEGKWGSKTLKIDTSDVNKDTPWFAVAFKKSETDADNYFIRCSKVSDDLYECVIPDGYTHFDIYRMAKGAKAFTTEVETSTNLNSTKAWNVTNTKTKIGTKTSYKLSFIDGQINKISISEK